MTTTSNAHWASSPRVACRVNDLDNAPPPASITFKCQDVKDFNEAGGRGIFWSSGLFSLVNRCIVYSLYCLSLQRKLLSYPWILLYNDEVLPYLFVWFVYQQDYRNIKCVAVWRTNCEQRGVALALEVSLWSLFSVYNRTVLWIITVDHNDTFSCCTFLFCRVGKKSRFAPSSFSSRQCGGGRWRAVSRHAGRLASRPITSKYKNDTMWHGQSFSSPGRVRASPRSRRRWAMTEKARCSVFYFYDKERNSPDPKICSMRYEHLAHREILFYRRRPLLAGCSHPSDS